MNFISIYSIAPAQDCPSNIDFETGTFAGWTCYTGFTSELNGENVISLTPSGGPIQNRHTMYTSFPGNGLDEYGDFPVNCPNGSGHSIKLGNSQGGGQAEGISYEFTIPVTSNSYNLIYNYAVVFEDPAHLEFQQPRMEIEIINVTDNRKIDCSSFAFFPNGSPLPGFNLSLNSNSTSPVWYKDWSAVSINLDGHAGKTIRLFFKTADCTFRRHFGYAYIDVNSDCSGKFVGASFCPTDTAVSVVAPYGYQQYRWFNHAFTQLLGTEQTLTLTPAPAVGTTLAVVLFPYDGYGCKDTLYAELRDDLEVIANAGRDTVSCNQQPVQLGGPPKPGVVYKWTPATGLSDPDISNPIANPAVTTTYYLTAKSSGGGCIKIDSVIVKTASLDNSLLFFGKTTFCMGSGDSAVFEVQPTDNIQWYKDGLPIPGASQTIYRPASTGLYYAVLSNSGGCKLETTRMQITISSIPVLSFTVNKASQCLVGNSFVFTNASTNALGNMEYRWFMGDGTEITSRHVTHVYARAGTYRVKLIVSSSNACADSSSIDIQVIQNAIPLFIAGSSCIHLPLPVSNNTADTMNTIINYNWSFGNGEYSNERNPGPVTYQTPGVYSIELAVSTAQCPTPIITGRQQVIIDKPAAAKTYPVQVAIENLPLPLRSRQFGGPVFWNPAVGLDNPATPTPVFRGFREQLYTIAIKTASGCATIDTQLVKIIKQIGIYVPTAFSPDQDGVNDFLKPVMYGIKQLNYFKIYNRWGLLLYQSNTAAPGWNGEYKGVKQEMQTYVWSLEAVGADGNKYIRTGSSILVR